MADAALPSIVLALRGADASACEIAALQLRDLVASAPDDTAVALAKSITANGEVVDAAFVHALRRLDLSQEALNALVLTMKMLYMKAHDECTSPSSAMMLASVVFLPILQRIIAQERPVSACRWVHFSCVSSTTCAKKICSYDAIRSISRFVYGIYGKLNAQMLSIELPHLLARVVDTDTDNDNRTCAMNCLNNIAAYLPSLLDVGNEAVSCALRVIREQGSGTPPSTRRFISQLLRRM
jgi:hypothetical protein